MEAARVNSDWEFFKKQPYGVLMFLQMVFAFVVLIIPFFAPFAYEGVIIIRTSATSLLFMSLMLNIFHLFGLNRKVISISNGVNLFIPCTLLVFGVSVIFFLIFAFNSLMAVVGFFDSLRYTFGMVMTYALLSCACAAETLVCFRLSVLLFRAAPNSQLMQLTTVIIDGDGTSRMAGSVPEFTPATSPTNPTVV